jgi:hypothetical protein
MGSPSKLMMQGGEWIVEGGAIGIEKKSDTMIDALTNTMKQMYDATRQSISDRSDSYVPVAATYGGSTEINVNFGDIIISNDMDMYEFETRVKTVLNKVIRR